MPGDLTRPQASLLRCLAVIEGALSEVEALFKPPNIYHHYCHQLKLCSSRDFATTFIRSGLSTMGDLGSMFCDVIDGSDSLPTMAVQVHFGLP